MPFSFGDHIAEFRSRFPRIPPLEAKAFVNQAVRDVFNDHLWPFAIKQAAVVTESEYNTGTVALTNGSTAVAVSGGTWVDGWTTAPSSRQFVGEGRNETYGITITQPNGTLSVAWQGDTNAAATYNLFRDVYALPADCDYMKAHFILDTTRNVLMPMKDLGVFMRRKIGESLASATGTPEWVTFVGLTASGVPQIQFGPYAPASTEIYTVLYFAKPVVPTSLASPITPAFPESFEDLIWRRAVWQAAIHPRYYRPDYLRYQQEYYDRFFEAKSKLDGQTSISRHLRATVPYVGDDVLDEYFDPRVRYQP